MRLSVLFSVKSYSLLFLLMLYTEIPSPFLNGCNMVQFMVVDMFSMMDFPQLYYPMSNEYHHLVAVLHQLK